MKNIIELIKQKKVIYGMIIFVILFLAAFIIIRILDSQVPETTPYFTKEPETWIEEDTLTEEEEDVVVNVMKATEAKSSFAGNKQDYFFQGNEEVFFLHGVYEGEDFDMIHFKPGFFESGIYTNYENLKNAPDNYKLMELTKRLDPKDGVIQGFILARRESSKFNFYIYIDEDWKNKLMYTNIIYGEDFYDENTLISKNFEFTEIGEGIYMNKIEDNSFWYDQSPRRGGIVVGKITKQEFIDNKLNSTFMVVR